MHWEIRDGPVVVAVAAVVPSEPDVVRVRVWSLSRAPQQPPDLCSWQLCSASVFAPLSFFSPAARSSDASALAISLAHVRVGAASRVSVYFPRVSAGSFWLSRRTVSAGSSVDWEVSVPAPGVEGHVTCIAPAWPRGDVAALDSECELVAVGTDDRRVRLYRSGVVVFKSQELPSSASQIDVLPTPGMRSSFVLLVRLCNNSVALLCPGSDPDRTSACLIFEPSMAIAFGDYTCCGREQIALLSFASDDAVECRIYYLDTFEEMQVHADDLDDSMMATQRGHSLPPDLRSFVEQLQTAVADSSATALRETERIAKKQALLRKSIDVLGALTPKELRPPSGYAYRTREYLAA
eukprot:m51a1_g1647 hypothetical protein (351) ;mRNA; f:338615-340138